MLNQDVCSCKLPIFVKHFTHPQGCACPWGPRAAGAASASAALTTQEVVGSRWDHEFVGAVFQQKCENCRCNTQKWIKHGDFNQEKRIN